MSRKAEHQEGGVVRRWKKTNLVTEEQLLCIERMAGLFAEIEDERIERSRRLEEKQIMKTMVFPEGNSVFSRLGQIGQVISTFLTNSRRDAVWKWRAISRAWFSLSLEMNCARAFFPLALPQWLCYYTLEKMHESHQGGPLRSSMISQNPTKFFKEVRAELKKVVWPTRKEAAKLTAIVVGVSLVVGAFVGTLDFVFTKVMEIIVR